MRARRLSATVLVLASAALTLTACGPDETPSAAPQPSASAAASSTAAPSAAAPSGSTKPSAPAAPSASHKPSSSAKPSGSAKPTDDCAARGAQVGRVLEATDDGYATHIWMRAKEAKFVCSPDDDGYFQGVGNPSVFTFSNDVKTVLLAGVKPTEVPLNDFMKHVDDCLHNPSSVRTYDCYGNMYLVTANSSNVITNITSLYHP
ncbi:hypothetical protein [Kitasatospora azatica]|uniref:hypothetical protein n=1 Tax=Kitasatospora azatica TaxID=58347 RepID=UPI00068CA8A7|nr:hypothetical protein [Kitasatospora azatica]